MTNNILKGLIGEKIAADHLAAKGYQIIERNYRHKRAEIDLIVKKDNWLIFVEVKTRSSTYFGFPEEFVDRAKELMIFYAADHYMYTNDWHGNVRYDIVAIVETDFEREIVHFEDAFY